MQSLNEILSEKEDPEFQNIVLNYKNATYDLLIALPDEIKKRNKK